MRAIGHFGALKWLLVLSGSLMLMGCHQEPPALRIGLNAWPGYEFLFLAQEKGFFEEEGVKVRIVQCGSLTDSRRGYERGQLDGLGCTAVELIQAAHGAGKKPKVLMVTDYSEGADVILARPGIRDVKGLQGMRVGLELGSLGVYMLSRALELEGMKLSDVHLVSLDQQAIEQGFMQGELDAVVTYPPVAVKLQSKPGVATVFSTRQIPHEVVDLLVMDEDVVKSRPDDVKRVMRAFERAVEFTKHHPDEAYTIMGSREGMSAQDFRQASEEGLKLVRLNEQQRYLGPEGELAHVLKRVERVLVESGQIQDPKCEHGFLSGIALEMSEGSDARVPVSARGPRGP